VAATDPATSEVSAIRGCRIGEVLPLVSTSQPPPPPPRSPTPALVRCFPRLVRHAHAASYYSPETGEAGPLDLQRKAQDRYRGE
jgi:hypothetical protein